ncbi:MAG: DNA polymerase III subunit chi [Rubrivivax sp.]
MITEVEFHTGVADPVGFACRLLRKAYRKGSWVLVTAPAATLSTLDRELWVFEERDFVPHLRVQGQAPPALAARTPIWLAEQAVAGAPGVLVNLGADAPEDLSAFERVIEIVGAEPEAAQAGRQRWRTYAGRGLQITHHAAAARS